MTTADGSVFAHAILETVGLPLLALDDNLRVQVANDAFLRQFEVPREETIGRLVYELGNGQWNIPELRRLLGEILPLDEAITNFRVEHTFESIGRRAIYLSARRIPREDASDAILLVISDVTEQERLQAERDRLQFELEGRIEFADKLIDSIREGLLILGWDLRVRSANQPFYDLFKVDPSSTEGRLVYEIGNGQWDIPELRRLLEDVLPRCENFDDYEVRHTFEQIGPRVMLLNGRRLDHLDLIVLAIRDITEQKKTEQERAERARRQSILLRLSDDLQPLSAPAAIASTAARILGEALGVARCVYYEAEGSDYVVLADYAHGIPPLGQRFAVDDFGRDALERQLRGEPVVVTDVSSGHSELVADSFADLQTGAYIGVPLVKGGQFIAGIAVCATAPREWTPVEVAMMEDVAERTWAAVEKARAEAALRASEARLRRILETDAVGVVFFDSAGTLIDANDVFLHMTGFTRVEVTSRRMTWRTLTPDRWVSETEAQWRRLTQTGRVGPYEKEYLRKDGTRSWMLFAGRDLGDGTIAKFMIDITDRKRTEAALIASEQLQRQAMTAANAGSWKLNTVTGAFVASDRALDLHGLPPGTPMSHERALACVHPDDQARVEAALRHTVDTGEPFRVELRAPQPDGTVRWLASYAERHVEGGQAVLVGLVHDISDRKRHEEQVQLLMREVNHRSKNTLALVHAIAQQTASTGLADFLERFDDRIQSLASAQDLLIKNDWMNVAFADLVRAQLSHFSDLIGGRISFSGPVIRLTAEATQAIGMALHELATNAAKHGALSSKAGCVELSWTLEDRGGSPAVFVMQWLESGGPRVSPPSRQGFGSSVLQAMVEATLDGSRVELDFAPTGLKWRLTCDARSILEGGAPSPGAAPGPGRPTHQLHGRRILVVEDEALLAEHLASVLEEWRFEVVGPAATVSRALALIEDVGCDAAVLDVNLRNETSAAVAEQLNAAGTPFVVVTGYSHSQIPAIFQAAPLLTKPLHHSALKAQLARLLDGAAREA